MTYRAMSKKTYATQKNAEKAAAKHPRATGETHKLPSGRFCFWISTKG